MSGAFDTFIGVLSILSTVLWLSSVVYKRRKRLLVENAKFVVAVPESRWSDSTSYLAVIPRESFKDDKVKDGRSPFKFIVIRPELEGLYRKRVVKKDFDHTRKSTVRTEAKLYDLKLIKETYNLDDIFIPKDNYHNFKNWQEIGEMLRETWRIDAKNL
ncbi:hypothetical protein [Fischerella sp. JS2]|uniref:hypothetical protein n=1 Tax=Fischerella sp. JS2 TaxID=2597771 RepID=UPI0028E50996|nr:hypothetical protein [Fischerella sp. JS2]